MSGPILYVRTATYRLDDGSSGQRDLDHCGNRKFRRPDRVVRGHLTSFQGDLNLVDTSIHRLTYLDHS